MKTLSACLATLALLLNIGTVHATVDWDDGFEYASNDIMRNTWPASCTGNPGLTSTYPSRVGDTGTKVLKETFNGHVGVDPGAGGCFMDRNLTAPGDTLYSRWWMYMENFTVDLDVGTKVTNQGDPSFYPSFWWGMPFGVANMSVAGQGLYRPNGTFPTVNFTGGSVPQNQWVCVETQITMSSPGKADGILREWINGTQTMNRTSEYMRGTVSTPICSGCAPNKPDTHFTFVRLYVQHGRGVIYYDNYAVDRSARIGCGGTIPPADTTPPSAPTSPSVSMSGTTATLNWTIGSDTGGSGLAGTDILSCTGNACTPTTVFGSTTGTTASFVKSGLTSATIYGFQFRSRDGAGNLSSLTTPIIYGTTGTTFRTTTFTDDMVRADAANLGANYTHGSGAFTPCKIVNNHSVPTTINTECFETYTGTMANDQWARTAIIALTTNANIAEVGPQLRWTAGATPSGYVCFAQAGGSATTFFAKYTTGTYATIASNSVHTWVPNTESIECEMQGTAYVVYAVNNSTQARTTVLSGTDATFASGHTGIFLFVSTGDALTDAQGGLFSTGEFSVSAPAPPTIASLTLSGTGAVVTYGVTPASVKFEAYSTVGLISSTIVPIAQLPSGVYTYTWTQNTNSVCAFAIDANGVQNNVSTDYQCGTVTPNNPDIGPATGVLRQLGTTPWFTNASGKGIYKSGESGPFIVANPGYSSMSFPSPAYSYLQDIGTFNTPVTNDYQTAINTVVSEGRNFVRIWNEGSTSLGAQADYDAGVDGALPLGTVAVQSSSLPWKMVSTRVDTESGHNRTVGVYDLSQFNPAYFTNLYTRMLYAVNHGVTPSLLLFVSDDTVQKWSASGNPFYCPTPGSVCNNVNAINADTDADAAVYELYQMASGGAGNPTATQRAQILAFQEAYVKKVIDTLNPIDGYQYEVTNEAFSKDPSTTAWINHIADTVTAYEATGGRKIHPVWISPYPDSLTNMLANTHAQIIGVWCDDSISADYANTPTVNTSGRLQIWDTDHRMSVYGPPHQFNCNPDGNSPWKNFLRGVHFVYLQRTVDATNTAIKLSQAQIVTYANKIDLKNMLPVTNTTIIGTGYGLKEDCVEYLSGRFTDGSHTVDLSGCSANLTFAVEYLDIVTGTTTAASSVLGGASRSFDPSGTNATVVYLKLTPPPPDTTAPTIFGCTPTGVQPIGTLSVTMQCYTDELATLKYGSSAGVVYAAQPSTMTAGAWDGTKQPHTATISGLLNGDSVTRYVRGSDTTGNVNVTDTTVSFSIGGQPDMIAPVMSSPFPTTSYPAGSGGGQIGFTVDELALCKYDTTDTTYALMAGTMTMNGLQASATVSGLSDNTTTLYYGRCQDVAEPTPNTDMQSLLITVTIAAAAGDTTPPGTVSGLTGTLAGLQATLTWTAATGGDVNGYYLYSCSVADCSTKALLQTLGNTTTTVVGLQYSTTYYWTVLAYDTSLNPSAAISNIFSATTGGPIDSIAPSDMANLRLLAAYTNSVLLTSDPGTDDRGAVTTTIELSPAGCTAFVFVYSKLTLEALVTNLAPSTSYCARGYFSDGTNLGGVSNTITFTTAASGLSQPRNSLPFGVSRPAATSRNVASARNPKP